MQYLAHDYQKYATNFIQKNIVSAILLECGLGKTIITLTAINNLLFDYFDVSKVLIIAPLRVGRDTWPAEIKKWEHLKDLKYSVVIGTQKEREQALNTKADIYIINRENIPWLVEKTNVAKTFDMIIIDELSSFKNHKAKRHKSLMIIRPYAKRIVALTGTPAGNGLMDLWGEFKLMDYGFRLGKFITHYRNTYFIPDKRNQNMIFTYKPQPYAEEQIYKKLSDITISMKAKDHIKMPELVTTPYYIELDEDSYDLYNEMKEDMVIELQEDSVISKNAAVLSSKLMQVSNGAIYTEDKKVVHIHDKKLDALEDIIEAQNGKPLLIAYWFKHDLERIKNRLDMLNINYKELKSQESIKEWNSKKLDVGLIHPASAGHGLNLQEGGSTLVWFGLTWSLEFYQQTNARIYRQGQKDTTVVIIHIISKDTIDEKILDVLMKKDCTQNKLLDAVKAEIMR